MRPVYLAVIASFICTTLFAVIITQAVIDPYLEDDFTTVNMFNFYENNKDQNKIYLLGDSVLAAVDPVSIKKHLADNNLSYNIYNMHSGGDTPKHRIVELEKIAESKPAAVVYCIEYRSIKPDDRFDPSKLETDWAFLSDRIKLDSYMKSLFNASELGIIQKDPASLLIYKKRFFLPAITARLAQSGLINSTKPIAETTYNHAHTSSSTKIANATAIYRQALRQEDFTLPMWIGESDNNNKRALSYMVRYLRDRGIKVIIITLPVNPVMLNEVSNYTKKNYIDMMKALDCPYYDLENALTEREFMDHNHLNHAGAVNASSKIADILVREMGNVSA